jgi:acyl-CoA reductase-like NAD-dependent aldehyde dehydrogenase
MPSSTSNPAPRGRGSVSRVTDSERPEPPRTGDEAVDGALAAVTAAAEAPLEERLAVLESVHRTLQERLADVGD